MAELYQTSLLSDANLKAYYRFESGALTTDSSGENHTLTAISDPAEITGKFGGAVSLDGDDAYSITDHADLKPTGVFTIGAWIKPTTIGITHGIFQSYSSFSNIAGIALAISNSDNKFYFYSGKNTGAVLNTDYKQIVSSTEVSVNNWYFVVVTWDGTSLRIYVDGSLDTTPVAWAFGPAYAATNYVRIGCLNATGTNNNFLTGYLDDVFLLNGTALTSDQIQSLYNRGLKTINGVAVNSGLYNNPTLLNSSYLKAYYRFKEGALTTDDSGENHTLTAVSAPIESLGRYGSGVYMTTDDAYSATDHADFKPTGAFTVGGWIKTSTTGATQSLFASFYADNLSTFFNGIQLRISTTNKAVLLSAKGGGTVAGTHYQVVTGGTTITDGAWRFIVGTWDGSYLRIYVDGALDATAVSWANAPVYHASNAVRIGCLYTAAGNAQFFTGSLDDVFLFNGLALSSDQIRELYSGGIKTLNGLAIASVKSFNGIG